MAKDYKKEFLDTASKLDALSESCGEVTRLVNELVEHNDDASIRALTSKIADLSSDTKYTKEIKQFSTSLKDCMIKYCGYVKVKSACGYEPSEEEDKRSLEELLQELHALTGLENVKQQVSDLIAYQKVQQLRRERGLNSQKNTLHMAFTGNPGTGKTTVARIVGHIYKQLGLLSKGHFIEVSRTDLIAGYQGQTALKVKAVIERAKGGVLFIDEAYSITENDHSDSYGRECLTELTKALEDYRDDLVVIVAGYTEPMNMFFKSNPGLKSRFNTFIEFGDYSADELISILEYMCKNNDYVMSNDLRLKLIQFFSNEIEKKGENFANARLARNVYDDLVMNHAKRIISKENPSDRDLSELLDEDFCIVNIE